MASITIRKTPHEKNILLAAVLATCAAGSAMAQTAGESPWLVRLRAVHLDSANGGSTSPDLGLSMNNKTIPEVDITYFFSPNLAAELVLTVPQRQTVYSNGTDIGTFKHLPPSLLMQYHFTNVQGFKPYVGAGVNYTRITNVNLASGTAGLEKSSVGGVLQAGLDIPIDKKLSFNIDVKKVYLRSDVFLNGANVGDFKIDPVLFGVGVGYRF
jgi:outer membrane protein